MRARSKGYTLFPYTTLFRSASSAWAVSRRICVCILVLRFAVNAMKSGPKCMSRSDCRNRLDRKSTPLNSTHSQSSYVVPCLKKKNLDEELELIRNGVFTDPK